MKRIVLMGLVLMSLFLFFSCSSSDDGGGALDDKGSTLSGVAAKGPVLGGTVEAFKVVGNAKGDSLGTATTSLDDGSYTLDLGSYTGPVLIEVTGGTYIDEASKTSIALETTLRAAVPDADGEVHASVTPFTEIAVQLAEYTGFTQEAITNANDSVSQLLGADGDILATRAVDVVTDGKRDGATPAEIEYSLMLAAVSQMAADEMEIDEVIEIIAEDLQDAKMDDTAFLLLKGLEEFAGSDYNDVVSGLTDEIIEAEEGLDSVSSIAEAKTLLNALIAEIDNEESFSDSYDAFINFMDTFVAESPKAHLFKAVASLMNIYHSDALDFITDEETGLGLNFETDFDFMTESEEDEFDDQLKEKAINLLKASDSFPKEKITALFAELESELEYTDSEFILAQGAEGFSISLTGFNAVYIDGTDVKVMRAGISLLKAVCEYVQSLELDVENYNVECVGCAASPTDIRYLYAPTEAQEDEFIANNPDILKLDSDNGEAKLAEFKDSMLTALTLLGSAVTDLDALTEDQRRNRKNTFTIDNEMLALFKQFKADYPVASNVLTDTTASLYTYDDEETSASWAVEGSYAYFQETIDIYKTELTPSTAIPPVGGASYLTIYDFVSGNKSLREILELNDELEDGQEYTPYVENQPEMVQPGVVVTQWDEPVDAYSVPLVDILSDGSTWDDINWDGIDTFETPTSTSMVKIARDGQNNFYVYCESTSTIVDDFLFGFGGYEWNSYNGYYLGVQYSKNDSGEITSAADSSDWSQIGPKEIGANAVVYKFESGYSKLSKEEFHQKVRVWDMNTGSLTWQHDTEIRLLPLITTD